MSPFQAGTRRRSGRRSVCCSVEDAAGYLGVSRATAERLVRRGGLPSVKIGGSTRYNVDDLDSYIDIYRRRNRKRGVRTYAFTEAYASSANLLAGLVLSQVRSLIT